MSVQPTTAPIASTSADAPAPPSSGAKPPKSARGRPTDDPDTRWSKTLSYILRHGAAKEGLTLRSDGFVRVEDLVRLSTLPSRARLARFYIRSARR